MLDWIQHNRLYDLARQGERLTPWWGVFGLGVVFVLVSSLFALPVELARFALSASSNPFSLDALEENASLTLSPWLSGLLMSLTLALSFGALIAFVWLWIGRYEKRPFFTLGFERHQALWQYARGFLLGLLVFSANVGLMAIFGYVSIEDSDPSRVGLSALPSVLLILLPGWLVQGAAEEVLIRGWMLPVLNVRYRPWLGILLSSLFFALMHGINPNLDLLALFNLLLYGVFAALYALREASLWGICAFHSAWNWAQGNLFGLAVSGQNMGVGTLLDLMEAGPDWFTGGAFGPEGGIASTLVLLISIVCVLMWSPSAQANPSGSSAT
ncbi:MAG: CPBP family intramembrane metalloprotease domain-containing protein [[Chlorobium] sp. 445]|nr:MAG: CPBP family intramembrane metalloprotease domain-containing protein [[Chlorobium] sp. 445]